MSMSKKCLLVVIGACLLTMLMGMSGFAQKGLEVAPDVPRNETLILENPSGRVRNPDNFNRWGARNGRLLKRIAADCARYPLVHRSGRRYRRGIGQRSGGGKADL